ncbi:MAG: 30S ribosomal protein S6 [Candidatus Sungbacteria bacterium]|nr:30S ribosomal protein S6 [Candidatus Sungbacteria bacterium]
MDTDSKKYEIAYLVSESVPEDDVVRVVGIITKTVEDVKGTVLQIEEPQKRRLAYPIGKARVAYFGFTTFRVEPQVVTEINKKLLLEKEIVRFLIVEPSRHPTERPAARATAWQGASEPVAARIERPRQAAEPRLSPEEREAAIKNIDKKLDEILGSG